MRETDAHRQLLYKTPSAASGLVLTLLMWGHMVLEKFLCFKFKVFGTAILGADLVAGAHFRAANQLRNATAPATINNNVKGA